MLHERRASHRLVVTDAHKPTQSCEMPARSTLEPLRLLKTLLQYYLFMGHGAPDLVEEPSQWDTTVAFSQSDRLWVAVCARCLEMDTLLSGLSNLFSILAYSAGLEASLPLKRTCVSHALTHATAGYHPNF